MRLIQLLPELPFKSDTISVKSPGPVEWVTVEVGDFVKKGDVLLKIENDELEADKNNKEGELSESLARLELEEKKLKDEVKNSR